MNRYPEEQRRLDDEDMRKYKRVSRLRPGDAIVIAALDGDEQAARAMLARVSDVYPEAGDAVLVATRQHGRRWYHTHGHPLRVVKEIGK